MRKRLIQVALALCLMTLTVVAARAADEPESGFRNVSVASAYQDMITLTPLTAAEREVSANTDGDYPDAVKMEAVYRSPQAGSEYLLFVLTDEKSPTVDNMAYIDQKTAGATEDVTFTIYPKKVEEGVTSVQYHVYMASNSTSRLGVTTYDKVASFEYYAAAAEPDVMLGDVNGDGMVMVADAVEVLKAVVGEITLTEQQQIAADVDKKNGVMVADAVGILRFVVGDITSFEELQT